VNVGRVTTIVRSKDQMNVLVHAQVDQEPALPNNLEGTITSQFIGGSSAISLTTVGHQEPSRTTLKNADTIKVHYVGVDLMPAEFSDLATELRRTSTQLRETNLIPHLNETIVSIKSQVERAGKVLESVDKIVSDEQMRKDIQASVANFRQTTETARDVAKNLDELSKNANTQLNTLSKNGNTLITDTNARVEQASKQMTERMQQVAKVLDNLNDVSRKLNEGDGTASKMLNDPKLYESLVDTSRELNQTIQDLKRLVDQWEQEGMHLKLGK
jgi:phospholipid/cholesterol/gamma-HCH transport system substrate-binding protein